MLNVLRDSFQNQPYLKWLLLLVAASLTLYLGSYFACGRGGGVSGSAPWAIKVNGEEVSAYHFDALARERARWFESLIGRDYDPDRVRSQVISSLIRESLAAQRARDLGLQATPEEVSTLIFGNPLFTDAQGNFVQRSEYERRVRDVYFVDPRTYERWLEQSILAAKWLETVSEPVMVTDDELLALFRERNERTAIRYVVVASADQETDMQVDEADLQAYYVTHPETFERPEGRRIRYALVRRDAMRARASVTEEEIAAAYEANLAEYAHPEQRKARQMLFSAAPGDGEQERASLRAAAQSALERLQAGEAWETVLADLSSRGEVRGVDLGFFSRDDAMVPELKQAAFETPVGGTTLVESSSGFHVLQVTEERAAGTASLDEKREEIRADLLNRRAAELARAAAERISDAAAGEAGLDAAAAAEGLAVQDASIRRGARPGAIGPTAEFDDALWSLGVGAVSGPLAVARGFAVISVEEELPAGIAPIEEVADTVRVAVLNERLRLAARAAADEAFERGKNLGGAAKRLGKEVEESGDLMPGQTIPRTGGYTPEATAALFGPEAAQGDSGVVPVPAGALIYEITRREPFDPAAFESGKDALRAEVLQVRRQALEFSVVSSLIDEAEIEINEPLIYGDRSG